MVLPASPIVVFAVQVLQLRPQVPLVVAVAAVVVATRRRLPRRRRVDLPVQAAPLLFAALSIQVRQALLEPADSLLRQALL